MKRQQVTTMFINPVKRKSVQGRSDYSYIKPDGTAISAERTFAKNVSKRYSFPAAMDGTHLRTGLSRMVENPWYGRDIEKINDGLPEHWKVGADWMNNLEEIVKHPKITKQKELEIRFNLKEGYLTNKKNLDSRLKFRKDGVEPSFLERFYIILYDRPNRFDDTTLRSALAMELAKVSKKIADGKGVVNPSSHDFYISEENEAAIERTAKQDIINNAITDLTLLRRNHTSFFRYQVAVILKVVTGSVSEVIVRDGLNKFISDRSKNQLKNIEEFNSVIDLVNKGVEGMNRLWVMYLLRQALDNNIMSIKSGNYIWHSKKGIDNLYNLGTKYDKIVDLFIAEYNKYDEESDDENWYKDLFTELKLKGVKLEE